MEHEIGFYPYVDSEDPQPRTGYGIENNEGRYRWRYYEKGILIDAGPWTASAASAFDSALEDLDDGLTWNATRRSIDALTALLTNARDYYRDGDPNE